MATILPPPETQWIDANGDPIAGGDVAFYIPGTLTPKDTYQNPEGTILNTNPVVLDAAGRAIIYGSGSYRVIVKDAGGNLVYDQLTADTAVGGLAWGGTSTGTPNAQVIAASSFSEQDGQQISFIVGAGLTNTGGTTVAPGAGAGIAVLKDTPSGPTSLTGGELVAGNVVTIVYDSVRGAFQLTSYPLLAVPIPNSSLAPMGARTIKGNNTGAAAAPLNLSVAQTNNLLATVTRTNFVQMTASATYTPSANLVFALVECIGGGGGGGSALISGTGAGDDACGASGGGAGGWGVSYLSAAQIGTSQAVTIGTAGAAGTSGGAGGAGGTTSFGALCSATGGGGGSTSSASPASAQGGAGGAGTATNSFWGENGQPGLYATQNIIALTGGNGGSGPYGRGGRGGAGPGSAPGEPASGYGGGGGGGYVYAQLSTQPGGAGTPGLVNITEFLSS